GIYELSNLRAGIDVPQNIPKNLSAHTPKPIALGKQSANPSEPAQVTATTYTLKVIMVEFQDIRGNGNGDRTWTRANFSNMLFSSNYYNTETNGVRSPAPDNEDVYGSLRDYYDAMSNGNLIITGQILNGPKPGGDLPNWIRLSQTKGYYDSHSYTILQSEAIDSASHRGYDTSTGSTTKLVILYAGTMYLGQLNPRNTGSSYIIFERWGGRGQYGSAYDYTAPFGHIGIHAHEFGHFFWLIDLYNSPYNITDWCLMGDACDLGGTLGGADQQAGSCPGPVNPEFRFQQGWITVQNLTADVLPASFTYNERTPTVYRRQIGANEYYYAESKRFQGYSRFLPGHGLGHDGGLLIWQVRRALPDTLNVYLERADNVTDGEYYDGEPNDIFPGPTVNNTKFHSLSAPNSNKLD
ncbi:MAG: hypothetical protein L0287_32165, partial [Anaerolineae bacterium]|nr:hypothetical protein [Anaerolineae bacterium]